MDTRFGGLGASEGSPDANENGRSVSMWPGAVLGHAPTSPDAAREGDVLSSTWVPVHSIQLCAKGARVPAP